MKPIKRLLKLLTLLLMLLLLLVMTVIAETKEEHTGVKIAILDSGVDTLAGLSVVENINVKSDNIEGGHEDVTGHGTGVANIINSLNDKACLYSVVVLNANNEGKIMDVVKGIEWCIENDINIINMSFGTNGNFKELEEVIEKAYSKGILMVSAASNDGDVTFPAAYKEVISVGAREQKNTNLETGVGVDIYTQGENIETKALFGIDIMANGSSFSVPYVVATASKIWETDLEYSNAEIRDKLYKIFPDGDRSLGEMKQSNMITNKHELLYDEKLVKAMWSAKDHQECITKGQEEFEFTLNELKIIKAGAIYPDKEVSGFKYMEVNPEWHGYHKDNYVASYIFATKIAKKAGDTSSLTKVNGQSDGSFNRMRNSISTTQISGKKWANIIKSETGLDYNAQSETIKKKWRKLFLYGMSIHISTDAFAHSCYTKETNGSIIELTHTRGADNPEIYKNRIICARETAFFGLLNIYNDMIGEVIDFAAADEKYLKGFYLKNITNNCINIKESGTTVEEIRAYFSNINY